MTCKIISHMWAMLGKFVALVKDRLPAPPEAAAPVPFSQEARAALEEHVLRPLRRDVGAFDAFSIAGERPDGGHVQFALEPQSVRYLAPIQRQMRQVAQVPGPLYRALVGQGQTTVMVAGEGPQTMQTVCIVAHAQPPAVPHYCWRVGLVALLIVVLWGWLMYWMMDG